MLLCCANKSYLINLKDIVNHSTPMTLNPTELKLFKQDKGEKVIQSFFDSSDTLMIFLSTFGRIIIYNIRLSNIQIINSESKITKCSLSNNSRTLFAVSNDQLYLYTFDNIEFKFTTNISLNEYITNITFFNSESLLCSISDKLILLNIKPLKVRAELFKFESQITVMKISPFFVNILALGLSNGSLNLIDLENNKIKFSFSSHTKEVKSLSFSPINKMLLVSIGKDNKIIFYDIIANKQIKVFETSINYLSLSFFIDGKTIACGGENGLIHLYDLSLGKEPKAKIIVDSGYDVISLDFSKTNAIGLYEKITEEIQENSNEESLSLKDINISYNKKMNYSNFAQEEEKRLNESIILKEDEKVTSIKDIDEIIKKELYSLKSFIHNEMRSIRVDILKQFQHQENEIKGYFEKSFEYYNNLLKEKIQLEKENMKLKKNYF